VQYENTIIESNKKHGSTPFKLVGVYPKEGAFWTQHPVGIPDAEWVTPLKREAAELYMKYLLEEGTQRKAMQIGLRPISKGVVLGDPFGAEYGVMLDVDASRAFQVPDERVLRRVRELWEEAKMPASIVLLLDVSGSMQGEALENAKKGAMAFIDKMNRWDELEVITFGTRFRNLAPLGQVRENGETAKMKIQNLSAGGNTCLYDAIHAGLANVKKRKQGAPDRRYGLVLLSDGLDTASSMQQKTLLSSLPRGDSPEVMKLYTIAYGSKADRAFLSEIAKATNARMFESSAGDIKRVYLELSAYF
jgi:Ca-activated chloride channel family protein